MIVALVTLALAAQVPAQAPAAPPAPTRMSDSLAYACIDSAVFAEMRGGFSGEVLVARGDTVIIDKLYGTATVQRPPNGTLSFWLASNSKQFTATAIMRLQELGRLKVTDSIGRYVANVPADKRGITLHQLLTHTSGLPHAYAADGVTGRARAAARILALKLQSAPGVKYRYSDDGYSLLAIVVDVASKVGFDAFVRDSLFARAELGPSTGLWGVVDPEAAIAGLADEQELAKPRPNIYRNGTSVGNWGYRGPTGAYASGRDLLQWIQALRAGRIIGEASLKQLLGRQVLVRADSTGQNFTGYGWGVRVEQGVDVQYAHGGNEDWLGHNSVIRFTPGGDVVIVLANSGDIDGAGWATRVNLAVRRALAPRP
ncbi:MAG: beta-lactamase family protein [Gemmatimonadetes bacterium]|nr:beta-lactamase family protein [Gemmatimonadota bacterium]